MTVTLQMIGVHVINCSCQTWKFYTKSSWPWWWWWWRWANVFRWQWKLLKPT